MYTRSEEWDGRTQGIGMKEHGDVIAEGISTSALASALAGE
jgi:hypothetical protein